MARLFEDLSPSGEYWPELLRNIEEQINQPQSKDSCRIHVEPDGRKATLSAFSRRFLTLFFENSELITLGVEIGSIPIRVTLDYRASHRLADFKGELLNAQQLAARILQELTRPV